MSILTDSHQHTLKQLAQFTRIKRQVAAGQLTAIEALDQLQQIELPGVQVSSLKEIPAEIILENIEGK